MPSDHPANPLIPGFDFLKKLAGQAGLGGFKQWVAPTLDPDELEKRIEELRTVQFWLEQNARMLGATIQALEVQKMTLSTLRSMNVPMPDLQQVLGAMVPPVGDGKAPAAAAGGAAPGTAAGAAAGTAAGATAGLVDPMKWWGDLSTQFQSLAAQAMAAPAGAPSGGKASNSTAGTGTKAKAKPGSGASPGSRNARQPR